MQQVHVRRRYTLPARNGFPALTFVPFPGEDNIYIVTCVEEQIGYVLWCSPDKWKALTLSDAGVGSFKTRAEAARACYAQRFGHPGLAKFRRS
jgi:hypothetical protein